MKLQPRNTKTRILTKRITSPETRKNPDTGKTELLLSYVDDRSNHQNLQTTRGLFLLAAGENREGQLPDGFDRLFDHEFVIHVNDAGVAFGLDVIPARLYRSKVVPMSQVDVRTLRFEWLLGGMVSRLTKRPAGTKAARVVEVLRAIDALVTAGKPLEMGTKLGRLGRIVTVESEAMEVALNSGTSTGRPVYQIEGFAEDDDDDNETD